MRAVARRAVVAAAVLALSACAAPEPERPPISERLTEYAARPEPSPALPPAEVSAPTEGPLEPVTGTTAVAPEPTAEPTAPATADPPPAATESHAVPPRPFRPVASSADAEGDAGLEAPAYADVVRITLADNGERARVTVEFAGALPGSFDDGEVIGVGVDLYRGADPYDESEYQLFADGGVDGWFAYLQTPDGFVPYPGDFRLGERSIQFELPWSSIGGIPEGAFSAFVDWSRRRPLLNEAGADRVPDRGAEPFRRT